MTEHERWLAANGFRCKALHATITPAQCRELRSRSENGVWSARSGDVKSRPPQCNTCPRNDEEDEMDLTRLRKLGRRAVAKPPEASIYWVTPTRGRLALLTGTLQAIRGVGDKAVNIYLDEDENRLVLEFVPKDQATRESYQIALKKSCGSIECMAALNAIGRDGAPPGRYRLHQDDKHKNVWWLNLGRRRQFAA